jgi:hypothetical protein
MRIPLEIRHGHILRVGQDGLELIDTGSPISMPLPAEARELLGDDVVRLVGMDELGRSPFAINWANAELTISKPAPSECPHAPMKSVFGIPCITIVVGACANRREVPALLDTGAPISYAPEAFVNGLAPHGEATDFYPGLGTFTTPLYHAPIDALGVAQTIPVGVLPPMLATALSLVGPDTWILGRHFFEGRHLHVDLPSGRLTQLGHANDETLETTKKHEHP